MSMWAAGLLRALDREHLALVGQLAAERDTLRAEVAKLRAERGVAASQPGASVRDPLPPPPSTRAQAAAPTDLDDEVSLIQARLDASLARAALDNPEPTGGAK
jgi:hypothetical protein